ncbi:MAG: LacI family DNA-binding transcriptional regulator [Verrucomicrobiae bacterium]|nr:LacI family DNA-binding transcriptional regulator [Verrucomicrobiae bacterium]
MQKIAEGLQLSRQTVSFVVNGKALQKGVPERTIQRVQEYIRRCGYVPSRQAVALRTGLRRGVGILHGGHLYSHLTDAFNQLTNQFSDLPEGLEIMLSSRQSTVQGMRELIARGVKKIVWIHTANSQVEIVDREVIGGLLSSVRTVIYNHHFGECDLDDWLVSRNIHLVGINRKRGYEKLAAFIKDLGHRVVFFPDVMENSSHQLDCQFMTAFQEAGIRFVALPASCSGYPASLIERGIMVSGEVLKAMRDSGATAACFRDDEVAGVAMAELIRKGIRIPDDLTVTGFDGHRLAPFFRVGLTTLLVPVAAMVQRTVGLLDDEQTGNHCHWFDPELILRESHGRMDQK